MLTAQNTCLVVIDIQEKLLHVMTNYKKGADNEKKVASDTKTGSEKETKKTDPKPAAKSEQKSQKTKPK